MKGCACKGKSIYYLNLLFLIIIGLTGCIQTGNINLSSNENLYSGLEEDIENILIYVETYLYP